MLSLPSSTFAKGSHDKKSHTSKHKKHKKHKKSSWDKGSSDKGSSNKDSKDKGSTNKGSKDSTYDECPVGTVPFKSSKGSKDKSSKGSSNKGSKDKSSKGSSNKGSNDRIKCIPIYGTITGTVYEDINNNGVQDINETGVANISIEIIDANGNILTAGTDTVGQYTVTNLPEGLATVTVDPTTLPPLSTLTAGFNPNDVTVVVNSIADAGSDGYIITLPAIGSISGDVRNGRIGLPNVTVQITDVNNIIHTVVTDQTGRYVANGLPIGMASVLVINPPN